MTTQARVLVVDDDPVVAKSIDRVLTGKGYAVITAGDGYGRAASATFAWRVVAGQPKLAASVAGKTKPSPGVAVLDLQLANTGSGLSRATKLTELTLRTLSGSGTVTLASPALPSLVGDVAPGVSKTVRLYLNVPATVTRFSAVLKEGKLKNLQDTPHRTRLAKGTCQGAFCV